ncbi:GNAT family N-acetyltransferase [Nonlabens marinus]|uniref:Acetyltransferase n=1 Tax=Nonlabens marinus S1-08 TaxID=1454201 RepID=W8VZK7_9FLAO|nr:GNAT family N-acetyltransferase [Nonlabens marinus]BAO54746.1 acetyltransferase [Nonlabens marinus S1-08]
MKYLMNGQETERLRFRLLEPSDYDSWFPFFADQDIYRFLFLDFKKSEDELCQFWMDKVFARYAEDRGGMNVIEDKHTGDFIGQCGLLVQHMDGDARLEVGYSLLPNHRGKGYALEAAQFARNYAFAKAYDKDFDNLIVSMIHVDNEPSIKVAKNNQMKWLKTFADFNEENFHVYGQTRASWEASVK